MLGVGQDENGICYTECGTRSYMAPEVLAKAPYDGALADLWSAGVVLFIMLAGNPPFQTAVSTDWWFKAVSTGRYDRFWAAHLRGCPDFPPQAQVHGCIQRKIVAFWRFKVPWVCKNAAS